MRLNFHPVDRHLRLARLPSFRQLVGSPELMEKAAKAVFRADVCYVTHEFVYDIDEGTEFRNVVFVQVAFHGRKLTCYIKEVEEGPRREALALELNNLLTDSPIAYVLAGGVIVTAEVPGYHPSYTPLEIMQLPVFAQGCGKLAEYIRLFNLGDRRSPNMVVGSDNQPRNIDFGTAFSAPDFPRFFKAVDPEQFEIGRESAKKIILMNLRRHLGRVVEVAGHVRARKYGIINTEITRDIAPHIDVPPLIQLWQYILSNGREDNFYSAFRPTLEDISHASSGL